MTIGLIVLGLVMVLVLFGLTQRVFDKMRLSTTAAVILILAMAIGVIIPPISIGSRFSMSIGGFLIPALVAVYLLVRVGFSSDLLRALVATIVVTGAVLGLRFWIPQDTTWLRILSAVIVGLIAGGISYLIGRSRRGAFVAGVMGVIWGEVIYFLIGRFGMGWDISLGLGVAGMFDAIILAGVTAVVLAEVIGNIRERSMSKIVRRDLQHEAGEDYSIDPRDEFDDYFRD